MLETPSSSPSPSPWSFSLSSMMLLVTVFAMWLALTAAWPIWGVMALVLVGPALVRVVVLNAQHVQAAGRPFSAWEKLAAFGSSLVVSIVSGGCAMYTATLMFCGPGALLMAVFPLRGGMIAATGLALASGATVFGWLFREFHRRPNHRLWPKPRAADYDNPFDSSTDEESGPSPDRSQDPPQEPS